MSYNEEKEQIRARIRASITSALITLRNAHQSSKDLKISTSTDWQDVHSKPVDFPPSPHTHQEIEELTSRLDALYARLRSASSQLSVLDTIKKDLTKQKTIITGLGDSLIAQGELLQYTAQKAATPVMMDWDTLQDKPTSLLNLIAVLGEGKPGQVLVRKSDGYTWEYVMSYTYVQQAVTPTPTFENPILWNSGDTDVLLWGSSADDADYLQWG